MSDWKSRAKPVSNGTNDWKSRAIALPTKDYNSPEALAAEGEATKMAELKDQYDKPLGVAVRSVSRGLSGGWSDELAGFVGGDEAKETERLKYKMDDINHPAATMAGRIGGGVATGAILPGAATLSGLVGYGAVQGLGESEAKDISGMAKDTALGGVMGAAGYGVGKAIPAVAGAVAHPIKTAKGISSAIGDAADSVRSKADLVTGSFKEGFKNAPEGVGATARTVGGAYNVAKTLLQTSKDKTELSDLANAIRKTYGPGAATDLSDEAVLMGKLLEPGDNIAKRVVASKYASVHGGDAEQYLKLLNQSADDTAAARSFNKIQAGEELAGDVSGAYGELKGAAGKKYEGLKESAKAQFQAPDKSPLNILDDAMVEAESNEMIGESTKKILRVAKTRLGEDLNNAPAAEQFDRILKARQFLDKHVKHASKTALPEDQEALLAVRQQFDSIVKNLDDMKSADAGYSSFKGVEKNLFSKLGETNKGRITGFDPIKIETLFSGSSTGRRLAKQVEAAQELLTSGKIEPEQAVRLKATLEKIQDMQKQAGTQRDLNNFRYKDAGPSSPAIQRMSAIAGKDSAVTTAVRAPQMFLKMREQAAKVAKSQFGQSIDQLKPSDREKVAKYALWISQNEGATDTDMKRKLMELGLVNVK